MNNTGNIFGSMVPQYKNTYADRPVKRRKFKIFGKLKDQKITKNPVPRFERITPPKPVKPPAP
jgi:hypothetical protein